MRAFDFPRADRKSFGEGLAIIQLVFTGAEISMADADRGLIVAHIETFKVEKQGFQNRAGTPRLQRVLLRLHPEFRGHGVRRDRLRGRAQILTDMIEIDQIAALFAEPLLDLTHDPWRAVAHRVHARTRPEPRPDCAGEQPPPSVLHAAFDPASVHRRAASLGVGERNFRLSPRQGFPLAFVFPVRVRRHDGDHAAIDLGHDLLVPARFFGKVHIIAAGLEHGLGMAQGNPLDRAFADLEAVMLAQFRRDPGKGIVRREIHDRPLQWPRTPARTDLRAKNKRAHTVGFVPVLRLYDRDFAKFRVPAEFFLPWRCIPAWPRTSRSVASIRLSAQPCSASRPKSRISSTSRSSAASASPRSPFEFSTAPKIEITLSRKFGWEWKNAKSASSLRLAVAMGPIPLSRRRQSTPHNVESHPRRWVRTKVVGSSGGVR